MRRSHIGLQHSSAICLLVILSASISTAQVSSQLNTGYPENGIFNGTDIENVQINNGGLHVEIPIFAAKARGFNVASKVIFNSKSWMLKTTCYTSGGGFCQDVVQGDPLSFQVLSFFGAFDYIVSSSSKTCTQPGVTNTQFGGYTLREPDGTKHHFVPDALQTTNTACPPPHYTATLYADDGSGWIMQINTSDGSIIEAISKNGTRVFPSSPYGGLEPASLIVDANGNQMSSSNTPCCVNKTGWGGTDSLGRTIPPSGGYYDSSGALRTPVLTGSASVAVQTQLCSFSTADTCIDKNTTWTLPNQLQLPNGDVYNFTYAQNGGAELASMTLPTGGQISYTWGGWDKGGRDIATRTVATHEVTGQWTYNLAGVGSTVGGTVTDPAQKSTRYTCILTSSGDACAVVSKVESFDGAAGASTLLKTVVTDYLSYMISGVGGEPYYLPIRETTTWNQQNIATKTETDWDTMAISGVGTVNWRNPVEKRAFDWAPVGATMPLLQRTHSSYRHLEADGTAYLNFNIADLPTLVQTYDGAGNLVAQTQSSYDGGSLTSTGTCQTPGVYGHDYCNTSSTVRGNATQVSRWLNTSNTWVNTTNSYDDLGNLRSTSDPLGHPTSFDYTDNWGGSGCVTANTLAFPTTVTNALGHHTKTAYYPCTSLVQNKKDENDIRAGRTGTTYSYDLMNRPLVIQTLDANGQLLAQTSYSYNDSVVPLSITKTVTAAPDPDIVSTVFMDGLGRTLQTQLNDPEGNVTTEIAYDALGRKHSETNPHRSVSALTDGTTQFVYDALGRTTDVIKQDNNTVHSDYAGNAVTVTDEALRPRRTVSDGLGRLIEVDEPNSASATTNSTASVTITGHLSDAVITGGTVHLAASGSPLSSVVMPDGTAQTFYFDPNQHINHFYWTSSTGWINEDITAITSGAVAGTASGLTSSVMNDGSVHVFYVGVNQHIYHHWWYSSGGWAFEDLTAITGTGLARAGTKLSSVGPSGSIPMAVFYQGADQHIYQWYWSPTPGWQNQDLTGSTGNNASPNPGTAISAAMMSNGQWNVFYIGTNQHLYQLACCGPAWNNYDVNAFVPGSLLPALGSSLTTITPAAGAAIPITVTYEGSNQHLDQLYWSSSAGWQNQDVTSFTGNVLAVANTALTSTIASGNWYVGYAAASTQHFDTLYCCGPGWANADLNSNAGSSVTVGANSGVSSVGAANNLFMHEFYIAGNQHIYDLYYNAALPGWQSADLTATAENAQLDSGIVTLNIGGFNATACFGPSTNANCTAQQQNYRTPDIASGLAQSINTVSSPATATVSGSTINLTWKTPGPNTTSISALATTHDNSTLFPNPSFNSAATAFAGGHGPQIDSTAYVTLYQYDALNNLTCIEQHGNVSSTGCSSPPSADPNSLWRVRRFSYDSLSRLTSASNPESGTISYQYNADSILTSKTDARGVTTNYDPPNHGLDALHRINQKTYAGAGITDAPVNYSYDTTNNGVGRLAAESTTATISQTTYTISSSFGYDAMGRMNLESNCLPSATCTSTSNQVTANYNDAGALITLVYPDGRNIATLHNAAGQMTSIKMGAFSYYTVPQSQDPNTWGYWPTGAMNRGTYHSGVIETTGYNNRLQVSSIVDGFNGSTALFSKLYAYSDSSGHNNGNIISITDTVSSARTQTFSYDPLNRIATGAQADNFFNLTYGYDPWGNMQESGTSNFNQLFDTLNRIQHPPSCNPIAQFCYDAAGDLLVDNHSHAYVYDAEGRIKTVDGPVATYSYNAGGDRVRKDASGTATEYVYFGGNIVAEKNPSTGAWTDYIFGYGGKRLAKDTSLDGTAAQYYHADHIGSVRVMTDNAGIKIQDCTFNPFGEQVSCTPDNVSNHYRFTGKERDQESGLDNFGARYNSSSTGRFMTPDPMGGEKRDPQTLNKYSYVRNNPINLIDPTGLYTCADQADCKSKKDIAFEKARQHDLQSKNPDVVRAARAFGDPTKDGPGGNKVNVTFKDLSKDDHGGTTVSQLGGSQTGFIAKSEVTIDSHASGAQLDAAVGHEGSHVADAQDLVKSIGQDPKTGQFTVGQDITQYQSEKRAYFVSDAILRSENESERFKCAQTDCVLGKDLKMPSQLPAEIDRLLQNNYKSSINDQPLTPTNQGGSIVPH